jgi:outer membrane protein, multidrug efflux system
MIMNKSLMAITIVATLAGCAVGPNYQAPATPPVGKFVAADAANLYSNNEVEKAFWKRFDDALLNKLVDDAVKSNTDIRVALANLGEAKALAKESRAQLLPTILANSSYKDSLDAANQTRMPNPTRAQREFQASIASIDFSWELDLAGRLRRASESARAGEAASEASLQDVMISITAEVARTYFELRGVQAELAAQRANTASLVETQKLVDARLNAGAGTGLDVARAKALTESARAVVPQLETAVTRAINRLNILTGKPPGQLNAELALSKPLPTLQSLTAIGTPEALLKRRPDVRAAEREVAAATARIGVAMADFYPRISIGGDVGVNAPNAKDWSDSTSQFWSFGPRLTWAFLDSGRIRANINRAEARTEAALARFDKTVLTALEETENALASYAESRQREAALGEASKAAGEAANLAKLRFEAGASDFLTLLDAERTRIQATREFDQARATTATSMVGLYKALAGGF